MAYQTIHGRRVRVASPKTVVQVSIHVPVAIGEQPCRGEHERFVLVRFSSGLSTSLCAAWPMVSAQRCSAIYTHMQYVLYAEPIEVLIGPGPAFQGHEGRHIAPERREPPDRHQPLPLG